MNYKLTQDLKIYQTTEKPDRDAYGNSKNWVFSSWAEAYAVRASHEAIVGKASGLLCRK